MSCKTILIHVDATSRAAVRIRIAAALAQAENAHLIGVAVTGVSPFMLTSNGFDIAAPPLAQSIEELREAARLALEGFERQMMLFGMASFESRLVDDEAGIALCLHGRYADLLVLGQPDPREPAPTVRSDFPEYVLLHGARPVLMVPLSANPTPLGGEPGRHALVAWNGGMEAARAVTSALSVLRRARQVDVMVWRDGPAIGAESRRDIAAQADSLHGDLPGADFALYLARHGVRTEVVQCGPSGDVGNALLDAAARRGADLIVMGAYGHARLRELLLGGATRTMLRSMTVPVWMMH